jgi:hypothetical protein
MGKDGLRAILTVEKIEICYGYFDNSSEKNEYALIEFQGNITSFSTDGFAFAENCSISKENFDFSIEHQYSIYLFESDQSVNTIGFIHFSKNEGEISIRRIAIQLDYKEFLRMQFQIGDKLIFEPIFARKDRNKIVEIHSDAEIYTFIRRMYLTKKN